MYSVVRTMPDIFFAWMGYLPSEVLWLRCPLPGLVKTAVAKRVVGRWAKDRLRLPVFCTYMTWAFSKYRHPLSFFSVPNPCLSDDPRTVTYPYLPYPEGTAS